MDTLACYAMGTGIGGGVVVNGHLHLGISGSAGELGHQIVDPFGALCNCGCRGCLETIAAGPAIAAAAAQAVIVRKPTLIADMVAGDLNRITPAVVIQAAEPGIQSPSRLSIAPACISASPSLIPWSRSARARILIGGGVAAAGDLLLDPIRRTVRERTFMVPVDQVEILPTALGDKAGLIGSGAVGTIAR